MFKINLKFFCMAIIGLLGFRYYQYERFKIFVEKFSFNHSGSQKEFLHKLSTYVGAGSVLDVGANYGQFQRRISRFLSKNKRYILIEPANDPYSYLAEAFINRNMKIFNIAASNVKSSSIKLYHADIFGFILSGLTSLDESSIHDWENANIYKFFRGFIKITAYEVISNRIDNLIDENLGLVKLDVQGHELEVLLGMTNLIEKYSPPILIELEFGCATAVRQFLCNMSYQQVLSFENDVLFVRSL